MSFRRFAQRTIGKSFDEPSTSTDGTTNNNDTPTSSTSQPCGSSSQPFSQSSGQTNESPQSTVFVNPKVLQRHSRSLRRKLAVAGLTFADIASHLDLEGRDDNNDLHQEDKELVKQTSLASVANSDKSVRFKSSEEIFNSFDFSGE